MKMMSTTFTIVSTEQATRSNTWSHKVGATGNTVDLEWSRELVGASIVFGSTGVVAAVGRAYRGDRQERGT